MRFGVVAGRQAIKVVFMKTIKTTLITMGKMSKFLIKNINFVKFRFKFKKLKKKKTQKIVS